MARLIASTMLVTGDPVELVGFADAKVVGL
jgi:hypothetical protein